MCYAGRYLVLAVAPPLGAFYGEGTQLALQQTYPVLCTANLELDLDALAAVQTVWFAV